MSGKVAVCVGCERLQRGQGWCQAWCPAVGGAIWCSGDLTSFMVRWESSLWTLGTLAGALIGSGIDTSALGLDAAAPAIFLVLLWPQLSSERARAVALGTAVVVVGLIPLAPAGLPIIAAAAIAIFAGLLPTRRRQETEGQ